MCFYVYVCILFSHIDIWFFNCNLGINNNNNVCERTQGTLPFNREMKYEISLSPNLDYKKLQEIREIMTIVRDGRTTPPTPLHSEDPLVQKIHTLKH